MNAPSEFTIIKVSFDIDQINPYLIWNVFEEGKTRHPYSAHGRHAGAIHFSKGEPILIQVKAFARPESLVWMNVLDAMIYTVPHTDGQHHTAPSPFSPLRATMPIDQWNPAEVVKQESSTRMAVTQTSIGQCEPAEVAPSDSARMAMTQTSMTPLVVHEENGRWKFSLILTMEIVRKPQNGGIRTEIRVFTFDPEIQVGSGTEPPRRSSGEHGLTRSG